MGFFYRVDSFEGLKIYEFAHDNPPATLTGSAYRINVDYEAQEDGVKFANVFAKLLDTPGANSLEAFVVAGWDGVFEGVSSDLVVEALVAAREQLPNLKHLFIGELLQDECEVSWIVQSDMSPIFLAYPQLETFRVRGCEGLTFGQMKHERLRKLIVEGGGLPDSIVREVSIAKLPQLEHLELWLGNSSYGNDVQEASLKSLLNGQQFPKLKYLGLRNDEFTDTTIGWLKDTAILKQLEELDLSLGTLSDEGANALAQYSELAKLKRLNLAYHYMTDGAIAKLQAAFPIVVIAVSDRQQEDVFGGESHRYNLVSE